MIKIGIIGTAGRRDDFDKLSLPTYHRMKESVLGIIDGVRGTHKLCLVSGGAAWADHLAVKLYLGGYAESLTLHLPTTFDTHERRFWDDKDGGVANWYHHRFSDKCYLLPNETLEEIYYAITMGASVTVSAGFFVRNALVAQDSDILIAATFGHEHYLKDGGTAHTMKQFLSLPNKMASWHVNLNDGISYTPAKVA